MRSLLLSIAALSALSLTACNDEYYDGKLATTGTLNIQGKQGSVKIPAGVNADTQIHISGSGTVDLTISRGEDQPDAVATIKLPMFTKADENGDFAITAGKLKQGFDLYGNRAVSVSRTEEYDSSESCIYGYHDGGQKCEWRDTPRTCSTRHECGTNALGAPICKDYEDCDGGGRDYVCETEQIPDYGSQSTTQYDTITTTKLTLKFVNPENDKAVAKFSGVQKETRTTVTSRGHCYR